MVETEDVIKLAEFVGVGIWHHGKPYRQSIEELAKVLGDSKSVVDLAEIPWRREWNPLENASDDVMVLEWVNTLIFSRRRFFAKRLRDLLTATDGSYKVAWPEAAMRYKTGYYARCAFPLIEVFGTNVMPAIINCTADVNK